MEAVCRNGYALERASEVLLSDRNFVMKAICYSMDDCALEVAPEKFRTNRKFVIEVVRQSNSVFEGAPENLKADPIICAAARMCLTSAPMEQISGIA